MQILKDPDLEGLGDRFTDLSEIFYIETGCRGRRLALNSGNVSLIDQGQELPIAAGDQALATFCASYCLIEAARKRANIIKRRYKPIIFFEHLGSF